MLRARLALWLAIALAACDGASTRPPIDPPPPGPDGARLYAELCASCHGESGEGGLGPELIDHPGSLDALASIIEERMPQGAPERCDARCARTLASFILARFTSSALRCDGVPPSPRRLRLLSRAEYRASVRDLLGLATTSGDPSACRRRTFSFDPGARSLSSVHLAGTFNGWAADAWPMSFDASRGLFTITREIPDGTHQYKFVLDGAEWIRDLRNPDTAPDGFGGENSLLRVACAGPGASGDFDPAATLPPDARVEGFLFDGEASAAIVTATHVDEHLRAARLSVEAARGNVSMLAACESGESRESCTDRFVARFGRRAFRRPLESAELARYRALALAAPSLEDGIAVAIRGLLSSPHFLYRSELGADDGAGAYVLDGFERATAISFQLWGTTPDDALLDAAASGELDSPAGLERHARRLLADPRARGPLGEMALRWLGVTDVASETRHAGLYPSWSPELGVAMREEARAFVVGVILDGESTLRELYTSRRGYANAPLASVYRVAGVTGEALVPIEHPPGERGGVLGLAAVLATYAHSDQTSPIQRGLFVRRNLLCQTFGQPPADAGGVPDVDPSATTRERFAQHTSEERCAGCHRHIDPVGFGFERFDAIGATRDTEGGLPIDARGDMSDVERLGAGTSAPFESLGELGAPLGASDAAAACFVRQSFRFARGYRETSEDRCAVEHLRDRLRAHGSLREVAIDIILSPDYVRRRDVAPEATP